MPFEIFPPIGIARVGNSPAEFFIGPETPGSFGTELLADGTERPVQRFKDPQHRMKRQAARFRLFDVNDDGTAQPAELPAGSQVRWTVELVNKKDAVVREDLPAVEKLNNPTTQPLPTSDNTRANRAISASGSPSAFGQAPVRLTGSYLTGTALEEAVLLGELTMDASGHLLVLGGHGTSKSPESQPIGNEPGGGSFYNNRGWYDDVSDGRVTAAITLPGANAPILATAWVIVAPPDFAPATDSIVTLYDVMFQAAVERQELTGPARPSFSRDVWPMLRRAAGLADVNRLASGELPSYWAGFSTDWGELAKSTASTAQLRADTATRLREIRKERALRNFSLRQWQDSVLTEWVNGNFESDFTGELSDAGVLSPGVLTRTVLDATAGQGFFPGIEAGIIVTNKTIYSAPFRIAAHVKSGDLTALMALPWQADFLECAGNWWPGQRPDVVAQKDDPASFEPWLRPIDPDNGHRDLVGSFGRLGLVAPVVTGGQTVFVEVERDPDF